MVFFLSVYSICSQMEGYLIWSFRKVPQYIMDPTFQSQLQHCYVTQNESIKCHCLKYISSFLSPKFILFVRPNRSQKSPENLPWLYSPHSAFILFILSLTWQALLRVLGMDTSQKKPCLPGASVQFGGDTIRIFYNNLEVYKCQGKLEQERQIKNLWRKIEFYFKKFFLLLKYSIVDL